MTREEYMSFREAYYRDLVREQPEKLLLQDQLIYGTAVWREDGTRVVPHTEEWHKAISASQSPANPDPSPGTPEE